MSERRSVQPGPAVSPELVVLVRSLSRALRALGYYDAGHPVIVQTLKDAAEAVRRLVEAGRALTLAGTGASLVYDATSPPLTDEPARILADALFQRSVIALRVEGAAGVAELTALLSPLAEAPDRVRLAGGVAALVAASRVASVVVLELDFGAVFTGDRHSLPAELAQDPVVSRAIKEVLRSEHERAKTGDAVKVDFAALADVDSLGSFLDDLVDLSEPAARSPRDPGRARPPPAKSLLTAQSRGRELSISVDEVADLAAEAYLENQRLQRARGAREAELVAGAQAMADALVRLSPEGRFALLRRLAGAESADDREQEAAVQRLGQRLDGGMVVEAVAAAISADGAESEVAQAVGNLVRRLFPVESERRRLLGALDDERRRAGRPLSGSLWQELQARALAEPRLGMLELDLVAPKRKLVVNAEARRRGRVPHVQGQEILGATGAPALLPVMAQLLAAALRDKRELGASTLAGAVRVVDELEQAGHEARADLILDALMARADLAPSPGLDEAIGRLLGGSRGGARTLRLVRTDTGGSSKLRGELLLRGMDEAPDKAVRAELLQRLSRFEPRTLELLGEDLADRPPARVAALLQVVVRVDVRTAVAVARSALKSSSVRTKELALKAMIELPQGPALALLAMATGGKGDDVARRLLVLGPEVPERRLQELQLVATSALGLTRSAEAVPHLVPLLTRQSLLPSRFVEEQRVEAARALAANGSREALQVLRAGAEHKKKNVREACERALKGRS